MTDWSTFDNRGVDTAPYYTFHRGYLFVEAGFVLLLALPDADDGLETLVKHLAHLSYSEGGDNGQRRQGRD